MSLSLVQSRALLGLEAPRLPAGEASLHMRARSSAARARAMARQGKTNQSLVGQEIDLFAQIYAVTNQLLRTAAARLG